MAQLTLQIDSPSLLEQLKNVLSLMKGVKIVSDSPISRSAALEDVPNAETLAAMKEAESGHDAGVVRVDREGAAVFSALAIFSSVVEPWNRAECTSHSRCKLARFLKTHTLGTAP